MQSALNDLEKIGKSAKPPITISRRDMPSQKRIAIATIVVPTVAALLGLVQVFSGSVNNIDIYLLVIFFILTNLGIEFGFHRNIAHRAFKTTPIVSFFFAILGSMAAQGRILYWVASHRRHHIHSDKSFDPHSPHVRRVNGMDVKMCFIKGWWHAHIGHMLSDDITNCTLFASDIVKDRRYMWINKYYIHLVVIGLLLPGIIALLIVGTWYSFLNGVLWGGLIRIFLVHHITWSVASISHMFGSKSFNTGDKSANNWLTALPSFGSGFQNNHHAFPSSAYLGFKWYQIDLTAWVIVIFSWFGLVWDVKRPTYRQRKEKSIECK